MGIGEGHLPTANVGPMAPVHEKADGGRLQGRTRRRPEFLEDPYTRRDLGTGVVISYLSLLDR